MTAGDPSDNRENEDETEADHPEHDQATDPSTVEDAQVAALDALGNEHRLEILLALGDRERETRVDRYELSFTELYEAVDVGSTSQFSYHLSQLVGSFVAETDEGYHLTYSGDRIVRTVRSGVYESTARFDPVAVGGGAVPPVARANSKRSSTTNGSSSGVATATGDSSRTRSRGARRRSARPRRSSRASATASGARTC